MAEAMGLQNLCQKLGTEELRKNLIQWSERKRLENGRKCLPQEDVLPAIGLEMKEG